MAKGDFFHAITSYTIRVGQKTWHTNKNRFSKPADFLNPAGGSSFKFQDDYLVTRCPVNVSVIGSPVSVSGSRGSSGGSKYLTAKSPSTFWNPSSKTESDFGTAEMGKLAFFIKSEIKHHSHHFPLSAYLPQQIINSSHSLYISSPSDFQVSSFLKENRGHINCFLSRG